MKFASWIRIPITPARKHETKVEPKSILECLFLKRVFVWNDYLDRLMGRLEMDSIGKMLAFSDTDEKVLWRFAVLTTAERELAIWGQEYMEQFQLDFEVAKTPYHEILDRVNGEESMIPSINLAVSVVEDDCEETSVSEFLYTLKMTGGYILSLAVARKYDFMVQYIKTFAALAVEQEEVLPQSTELFMQLWDDDRPQFFVLRVMMTAGYVVRNLFSYLPYISEEWPVVNIADNIGLEAHYSYSVIGAPILEELIKHVHPYVGYSFTIFEFAHKVVNYGVTPYTLTMMLLCVCMHIITTHMNYDDAVIAHSIYNAILWNGSFR
jgi:hypothetical protein